MTVATETTKTPVDLLNELAAVCTRPARLWTGDNGVARLYLKDQDNAYIMVDRDGDLIGNGPKLGRAAGARVWGPWEKAARTLGRKLHC